MLRQLIRDSAIYGAAGILVRATLVLLLPVYTRLLSPAEIGALDLLTILGGIVSVTVALEVSQGFARYYPDATGPEQRSGYLATAFWFTVATYSAFAVVGMIAAPLVDQVFFDSGGYVTEIRLAVLSAWLSGIVLILLNQFRFDLRPWPYVFVSLTQTGISVTVSIILVAAAGLGLAGVLAGQIVGLLVAADLALFLTWESRGGRPTTGKLGDMLRFSLPLVPSSLGVYVTQSIDRIALNALLGLTAVGIFGVGFRVAQSVSLLIVGVQLALTPLIYRRYHEDSTPAELARIFRYFVALALLVCCSLALAAPLLIRIFATPEYDAAIPVIPILAPALLLANMYVFAPGLSIAKRTGRTALLNIGGAGLNTVLNLLLIPSFGITGAASANLISACAVFTGYMVQSQRTYPVPHHWAPLGVATGLAVLVVVAELAVLPHGAIGAAVGVALLGLTAVAFIVLGLVRVDELRSAWRRLRRSRVA